MIKPIPNELIDSVMSMLQVSDEQILSVMKLGIYDAALAYVCTQSLSEPLLPAKGQKAKIRQLAQLAHKLLNVSKDIQWEYFNTLDYAANIAGREDVPFRTLADMQGDLHRLVKGCELFLEKFRPTKGARTNLLLQEAVRELISHIRDTAGIPVTIARNKHSTGEPTFSSNGARAIGVLLRGIDPQLSETAIANMIDKVASGKLSADPYEDLLDFFCEPIPTFK